MRDIGASNLSNLIGMGFGFIVSTSAPKTAAELGLSSFKLFGHVCKSTELSLFTIVPRLAIAFGVSTIFWVKILSSKLVTS